MNVESIDIAGVPTLTLKDLLKPRLRAVFVGINPSPVSVAAGHYYQGRLGKRFWSRLEAAEIVRDLTSGREDDVAFDQGFGFTDVVKRPTASSSDVPHIELVSAATTLASRLEVVEGAVVVFVFKRAHDAVASGLAKRGWEVDRMPGAYEARERVEVRMKHLARKLMNSNR